MSTELVSFFEKLGYVVDLEGKRFTGERWYDVYDNGRQVFQIDVGVPLKTFLLDLPSFARGEEGRSNTNYNWATRSDADTQEMTRRAKTHGFTLGRTE